VLFSYFAQWFTGGFLRSDRGTPEHKPDLRKNESNPRHRSDEPLRVARVFAMGSYTSNLQVGFVMPNPCSGASTTASRGCSALRTLGRRAAVRDDPQRHDRDVLMKIRASSSSTRSPATSRCAKSCAGCTTT
jgi:hypothetical protein